MKASKAKVYFGFIGVMDPDAPAPVAESCCDAHGDFKRIEVYQKSGDALERWAHVKRVRITIEADPVPQPAGKGRI